MLRQRSRLNRNVERPEKLSLVLPGGQAEEGEEKENGPNFHQRREMDYAFYASGANIEDFPDI